MGIGKREEGRGKREEARGKRQEEKILDNDPKSKI
jgi:hypothetical protein